jgi:hypothetical protein
MAALKIQKFSLTLASHWLALYWHLFCVVCAFLLKSPFSSKVDTTEIFQETCLNNVSVESR